MKLSKQIDTALKAYRKSPLYLAENKEYLEKDDGSLVSRVAKLEEALEFYSQVSNWVYGEAEKKPATEPGYDYEIYVPKPLAHRDSGARAREALKEVE